MKPRWWTVGLLAAALARGPAASAQAVGAGSPHGPLPEGLDCAACHTAEAWTPLREPLDFDHDVGDFPLTGSHDVVSCAGCHLDLRFDGPEVAPADCASCHVDVHEGAMAQDCTACHDTRSFAVAEGEALHARTSFPLTGAHRQVTCESCHVDDSGGAFSALPTDCVACHRADFEGALSVDHVANGYPTDCLACHVTQGWNDGAAFDHAATAGYPLVGAHSGLRCASCHQIPGMGLLFQPGDANDCVACHQDEYEREHAGSSIGTQCASCHSQDTWEDPDFDHAMTGFQLLGAHADEGCESCHTGNGGALRFPAPAGQDDCVACHQTDYDDEHAGSGFPTTCLSCHGVDGWDGATFDHATTGFALLGAHASEACTTCHAADGTLVVPVPAGQDDCVACHQTDYDARHAGSGFSTACLTCHTVETWAGAEFDHATTGFALLGAHASEPCTTCHAADGTLVVPVPAGQDDCVACHQIDYDAQHAGSGFPTTCITCHGPDSWTSTFDHDSQFFPIYSGRHDGKWSACADCHTVPTDFIVFTCLTCHTRSDTDPEHDGVAGYQYESNACLSCHPTGEER